MKIETEIEKHHNKIEKLKKISAILDVKIGMKNRTLQKGTIDEFLDKIDVWDTIIATLEWLLCQFKRFLSQRFIFS